MLTMASRWWAGSQQTRTLLAPAVAPGAVALITINGRTFRRAISSKLNIFIITIRWSCFRVASLPHNACTVIIDWLVGKQHGI
jgi:hypothetical protein